MLEIARLFRRIFRNSRSINFRVFSNFEHSEYFSPNQQMLQIDVVTYASVMTKMCSASSRDPLGALGTVAFLLTISSISILILAWGCLRGQEKWKSSRNSNLLSNCAVFQPRWNKLWKTAKQCFFQALFGRFFEVYSILAEKQHNLTKNSSSLTFSASLDPSNIRRQGLI